MQIEQLFGIWRAADADKWVQTYGAEGRYRRVKLYRPERSVPVGGGVFDTGSGRLLLACASIEAEGVIDEQLVAVAAALLNLPGTRAARCRQGRFRASKDRLPNGAKLVGVVDTAGEAPSWLFGRARGPARLVGVARAAGDRGDDVIAAARMVAAVLNEVGFG